MAKTSPIELDHRNPEGVVALIRGEVFLFPLARRVCVAMTEDTGSGLRPLRAALALVAAVKDGRCPVSRDTAAAIANGATVEPVRV